MGLFEFFASIFRIFSSSLLMLRGISVYTFSYVSRLVFRINQEALPSRSPGLPPNAMEALEISTQFPVESELVRTNFRGATSQSSEDPRDAKIIINIEPSTETSCSPQITRNPKELKITGEEEERQFDNGENSEAPVQNPRRWIQKAPYSRNSKRKLKGRTQNSSPRMNLNHFIAFQVSEAKVLQSVREVQGLMMRTNVPRGGSQETDSGELYRDTLISPATLHFTLHVVELKDDNDKANAKLALERVWNECKYEIQQNPVIAEIQGMGHFNNSVLFARMEGEEQIRRVTTLAEQLKRECASLNIRGVDGNFVPHMTLAKISKSRTLREKGIQTFPRELWNENVSTAFGTQKVNGIQLLSMQEKDPVGYYKSLLNLSF